jgi:isoleucyl-tRNA synthetase
MLFEDSDKPHPFKNCIVLGLMLAEWYESKDSKQLFLTEEEARDALGKKYVSKTGKMSKSLRNYRSPQEIFDNHGADALRWYFFANQPPHSSIIYAERAIRDSIPEFLLRLWNVLSFFTIYAPQPRLAHSINCLQMNLPLRRGIERSNNVVSWTVGSWANLHKRSHSWLRTWMHTTASPHANASTRW